MKPTSAGSRRIDWTRWSVTLPPSLFLILFFLLPALIVAAASFREPGDFGGLAPFLGWQSLTLESYRFFFSDAIYLEIFARSFLVALI
ncbi:MAG: ABC transporter permease, partial [Nevskiales bacterium]